MFSTTRTPLSGGNSRHTRSDSLEPFLFIEAKYRQKHSVLTLFRETKKLAAKEKAPDGKAKIPVVALAEKNQKGVYFLLHSDDLFQIISRTKLVQDAITRKARWLLSLEKRRTRK